MASHPQLRHLENLPSSGTCLHAVGKKTLDSGTDQEGPKRTVYTETDIEALDWKRA